MRHGETVFVDTGAWIALALTRDPYHLRARELWEILIENRAKFRTSIPVVLETFTFLDRNANRDVALAWKGSLESLASLEILPCDLDDLEQAWQYFGRRDLHKLSAVDATSFAVMKRYGITLAFAFDYHFSVIGFRLVG